ncbi:MAG TPA: MBL fold metallo-hydrolase, partial [Candidatus Omnitrophota bacterium]|nr:MBL fold metallo-hydrolase [Candidatus Omnitrophota bacterium]
ELAHATGAKIVFSSVAEAEFDFMGVADGERYSLGDVTLEFRHTPGHTPGSQCFLTAGRLLTGDTLFFEGCGRCDLPGGNARRMYDSLYNVILKLPESTLIYPGHDYGDASSATLGEQKQTNPYLRCRSPEEFLTDCLGINP